ncbi:MAG TPA: hypothetical protein VGD02_06275 [Gemmatimonadaceae bacterium]
MLVGLSDGTTFWIVRDADSMRLAWRTPHLIVPRDDGYWFVATAERCGVDLGSAHGGGGPWGGAFIDRRQAVQIARAGSTAVIDLDRRGDCKVAEKRVVAARGTQYRAALRQAHGDSEQVHLPLPDDSDLDCTGGEDRVTFLSTSAMSIEHRYSQTEFCSPGGYATSGSNEVRRIGTGEAIPLRPMLPHDVREKAERERGTGETCAFNDSPEQLDSSWIVHRFEGQWVADLFLEGPNACRGGEEFQLNLPLPISFTGEPPLPKAWDSLAAANPGLTDATVSPSRGLIALRFSDKLVVHRLRDGQAGEAIGTIHGLSSGELVMIRWASVAEVARWTHELPSLVPPRIRVVGGTR